MSDYEKIMEKIRRDERCKPKNCPGPTGPRGPQGPQGPAGSSVRIMGKYDTYEDFIKAHPEGTIDESYLINGDLYVWNPEKKDWEDIGRIEGPQGEPGPKGDKGDKGEPGPTLLRTAYLVTFNGEVTKDGVEVPINTNLPITRKEIDITNLVTLNTHDNTIKFNEAGYYKVTFIVSSAIKKGGLDFNPNTDFVTIGFRQKNTDNIYIGASEWLTDELAHQVVGHGVISIPNPNLLYEFTNLGKKSFYLNSPSLNDISSSSYFTNSLVTLVIDYLGRQEVGG